MKVLFVFSTGKLWGSAPAVWLNLLDGLPARGVEPYVVMPHRPDAALSAALKARAVPWEWGPYTRWVTSDGTPQSFAHRVRRGFARQTNTQAERAIGRIIDKQGIELVYICDGTITAGLDAAVERGIPVVWHIHEFIRSQRGEVDSIDPEMHVGNRLAKADRIITVTKSIRTDLIQRFPALRDMGIKAIYNGVQKSRVFDKPGILEGDEAVFTIVGRLVENKGQAEALCAFARVAREHPHIRLHVVGTGPEEEERRLRELAHKGGVADRVDFRPITESIAEVWRETDVILNCSFSEGCPVGLCEAMTSGCLALCSTAEGNVELIDGKYGLVYQRRKVEALEEKMLWVLSHESQAREIALRGKRHAERAFDLERQVDAVYQVFSDVLGKH